MEDCAQEVMAKMYEEYDKLAEMDYNALAVYIKKWHLVLRKGDFIFEIPANALDSFEEIRIGEEQEALLMIEDSLVRIEAKDSILKSNIKSLTIQRS